MHTGDAPLASTHSSTQQVKSSSVFIPPCWLSPFTCNAVFFQREGAADLLKNDAIIVGMDESKSQQLIPFPALAVCPFSRGRGTTSKYDAERNIIRSGVMICIVSTAGSAGVYKIWPHHCTRRISSIVRKGQSSDGNVKMSLNIGAILTRPVSWLVLADEEVETGGSSEQRLSRPS